MERPYLLLATLVVLASAANPTQSQPPPTPEQDYSVDFEPEELEGCTALDRPPQTNLYAEALRCGGNHVGYLSGYDRALARCFEGNWLFAVRPYTLECEYRFDTNADFSTTNHSVSCTSIKRVDQAEVERFALEFGKTLRYVPPVVRGKMQLVRQQVLPFKFVCE